jgi:hypothetical protein
MAKPFKDRPGHIPLTVAQPRLAKPVIHRRKRQPERQSNVLIPSKRWIEGRGKPLNVRRLNSLAASQNGWRAGSRG